MAVSLQPHEPDAGEKIARTFSPWIGELKRRQGQSYARIAARKMLVALTGKRMTAVHLRANGERRFDLAEIGALAKSPDAKVNAMEPIAEALAVVAGARRSLDPSQLVPSVLARSTEEQKVDGAEDQTQIELHDALAPILAKGIYAATPMERRRAHTAAIRHRHAVIRCGAKLLAVAGDLEALIPQLVETAH